VSDLITKFVVSQKVISTKLGNNFNGTLKHSTNYEVTVQLHVN